MKWLGMLVMVAGAACAADLQRGEPPAAADAVGARDANPGEGFFDAAGASPETPDASEQQLPGEVPVPPGVTPVDLLARGSSWRYLDDGSDQGTAWSQRGFDATTWPQGNSELGYGEGDEATVIGYGGDPDNKFITTYFRHGGIDVPDPAGFVAFVIDIKADDGAVVYLNGTELQRLRLPDGTIDYLTQAADGTEELVYDQLVVPSELVVAGSNLLAVEVHQNGPTSSDVSFDLGFVGIPTAPSP